MNNIDKITAAAAVALSVDELIWKLACLKQTPGSGITGTTKILIGLDAFTNTCIGTLPVPGERNTVFLTFNS